MNKQIQQKVNQSSLSISNSLNRCILILRSEKTHDDLELVVAGLSARNVKTYIFNMSSILDGNLSFADFINSFDWSEIDAIDLRYCIEIARKWEKGYKNIFRALKEFLDLQQAQGNAISVTPSFETLHWVLDKAGYLTELQEKGIPTVPTAIIPPGKVGDRDRAEFDIVDYLNQDGVEQIVLKPAIGSGADGLEFIKKIQGGTDGYEVKIYSRGSDHQGIQTVVKLENARQLQIHFQNYLSGFNIPILIQNFERIKYEISAVFVGKIPHFIERSLGSTTGIAHEKFGGENIFIVKPPESWQTFAKRVYEVLPDSARNTVSIRIDIFERVEGQLILSEIEGASHRVMFPETLEYYK